ncbi:hypothetical protein [Flavobacterium chungangensis]|uniref:Uncharacterized protein n=1 Tax=Flavobacterium chungangensis TaxID=2708132 RepID=A0ABV8ZEX8_9FLAO
MKRIKKIVKLKRITSKNPKIVIDPSLNELKDIKFKSGKPDEISKLEFKLSF